MATTDVRKTLTDAGYIAIGLGVMGVQQAQVRGRELRATRLAGAGDCVSRPHPRRAAEVRDTVARSPARTGTAEEQVAHHGRPRARVARRGRKACRARRRQGADAARRAPERVVQAMEPVAARVRELTGNAA